MAKLLGNLLWIQEKLLDQNPDTKDILYSGKESSKSAGQSSDEDEEIPSDTEDEKSDIDDEKSNNEDDEDDNAGNRRKPEASSKKETWVGKVIILKACLLHHLHMYQSQSCASLF